ncbi:hemagglutinin repeat-containing protein [Yersinia pestis]|uniref:hemagglutinin repeat-containing protein n=1 Tax=Yersinia pestis TaxID=632 RepID=UPI0001BB6FF0|nr:hemagglutinin repeat-containing protein [Yersinia pestis]ACY60178.1 putative hemolysin HlyA [Yersinia pestis D106004]
MKKHTFKLSPAGKLAAAVTIISVSVATCYAAGIVGAGDSAHKPDVSSVNGTSVINIVQPSASGLSHNQFQDFNVGEKGAVLNNATSAGNSILAGQLAANQNLNGQAASIILNEVISRNPSLLLGQQEIFGMTADYILANPNGITCNGCGFMNTNRESLVVGNPLIEQGSLKGFETFNNNNWLIIQDKGLTANKILDLIAPRIEVTGMVTSTEAINALSGNNQISTDGQILESRQEDHPNRPTSLGGWFSSLFSSESEESIDGKYLGSMQSGRINLVSTREGSGVKIAGSLNGSEEINATIKGKLQLEAAKLGGNDININANSIQAFGNLHKNEDNGGVTQSLERTQLKGKNIAIVANKKNQLSAVKIDADNVTLRGGELVLDERILTKTEQESSSDGGNGVLGLGKWNWSENKEEKQQTSIGTTITAKNNASLESTQDDIKLSAATITAGKNLAIKAKKDLHIDGAIEENSIHDYGHNYKHMVKDESWNNKTTKQTLNKTTLEAGKNLGLTAENKITTQGIKASAGGDVVIDANDVKIGVQKTSNQETTDGKHERNLGLGGVDHNNNDKYAETSHSSEITADGNILISVKDDVAITGSKVKATKDGFVQAKEGGIKIDNAISTTTNKVDERTGVAFDITGSSKKANNSEEKSTGSEVVSEANLKIISKKDVDVIGSLVKSAGELGIETLGDINVAAAQEKQKIDEQKTLLTIDGFTSDDGKNQYQAGLKVEHTSESEKTEKVINHGSTLEGGTVKLEADKDVTFTGSQLNTTKGDADITAENVSFVAAQDTTTSNKEKETVGVNAHYTGGMDKAGSGAGVSYEETKTDSEKSTAVVSHTDVKGDLNLNAKQEITNQGTDHNVEGSYAANATNVNNLAAENSETTTTTTNTVDVKYGGNIAYDGVTRPVEKTIESGKKLDVGGVIENVGNVAPDSVNAGVDLSVNVGEKENKSSNSQAVVTSIKSGDISITAKEDVKDQGTHYQADKGGIKIDAANHTFESAVNRAEESEKVVSGGVDMRIYTTTGEDINVDAKGKGENKQQEVKAEQAQTGSMKAVGDIIINVQENARYQGTDLDSGDGKIAITAGEEIKFEQATSHLSENHNKIDANAKANFGTKPNSKDFGGGLGGGHSQGSTSADIAQVSHLHGKQGIELNAGKDLTLQGTEFGSKNAATGDVQLTAGGKVDFQAAQSQSSKQDMTWSASVKAGKSKSNSTSENDDGTKTHTNNKGFSAGAEANVKNTDETSLTHQGGIINSNGAVTIKADGKDQQAIHLQNTNIISQETILNADNGGIVMESAQDKEHKNNWNVNTNLNGSQKNTIKSDDQGVVDKDSAKKIHNAAIILDGGVDKLDSVTQQNTHINSDKVTLNSAKNTELAGAVLQANQISGQIGGDLNVISRENRLNKVNVSAALGGSHSNAKQDSLISQVANASPIMSDKIKNKLEEKSTKIFDKVENKFNTLGKEKDDSVQTISYTKDGQTVKISEADEKKETKDKWWQKGAKSVGKKIKSAVQDEQVVGGNGSVKANVEVVESQGVEEQSAIRGTQNVDLTVKGKTDLVGGKISSKNSDVKLKTNGLETQDINGKYTEGGARLNASSSVMDMISDGAKDVMDGKAPLVSGHGKSEQKNATGGITRE